MVDSICKLFAAAVRPIYQRSDPGMDVSIMIVFILYNQCYDGLVSQVHVYNSHGVYNQ